MPLSTPVKRKPLHNRKIHCDGYLREDGLIEIEGHMTDTKPYDFPNKDRGGFIHSGEALHGISARITLDDSMTIVDAEAVLDHTPYNYCKIISPVFKQLTGIQIGPGWKNRIREVMGATKGCTHLTELLDPMATTAFQTLVSVKTYDKDPESIKKGISSSVQIINTCHTHAADSPVVEEHWPEYFEKKTVGER